MKAEVCRELENKVAHSSICMANVLISRLDISKDAAQDMQLVDRLLQIYDIMEDSQDG